MARILEKIYVGFETGSWAGSRAEKNIKLGSESEKNHSGSTTLLSTQTKRKGYLVQGTSGIAYGAMGNSHTENFPFYCLTR
jgi:hypothetical protein